MNKSMMNSCIAVAILFISLVSLSSAACPWYIKGEFYSAQCGVEMTVPAVSGLLANDPQAKAILNPELIKIDPKYGTIDVEEDGSFVYKPARNMLTGTYVMVKYNATNGVCQAKIPGVAKFQVACKCRPYIATLAPICLPITIDEIKQLLEEKGVGCIGCGDITTTIDLSNIDLDANGNPVAGTYSFCIKCPGCQAACGQIVLIDRCDAEVEDYRFCEGTVTPDELEAMAEVDARCIGCDLTPVLDFSGVTVDDEGYVSGGSYTGTCGDVSLCGGSDTGYITVVERCNCEIDLVIPSFCITEADLETQIMDEIQPCNGSNCDVTPIWNFPDWPDIDNDGFVDEGTYEYSVTCLDATGLEGCDSVCTGLVTVVCFQPCVCEANAPSFSLPIVCVCEGCECRGDRWTRYTAAEIKEKIILNGGGCAGGCTTMTINLPDVQWNSPGTYKYTITCTDESGECSDTAEGTVTLTGVDYCH